MTADIDLLRQAATQIRDNANRAAEIAPGEWYADPSVGVYAHGGDTTDDCPKVFTDFGAAEAVITHIAGWGPLVATAVADWLDWEADRARNRGNSINGHALAVARAFLAPTSVRRWPDMTIDIDAIRQRRHDLLNAPAPGLSTADVLGLLREVEQLIKFRAQVAELVDQLHKANAQIHSLEKATTAYANENAELRKVVKAVDSLLAVTDGDPLGDRGIAISLGEIRRVVGEARGEVA